MKDILITTSTDLEGYKIVQHLGVIRGITVRSRGIGGNVAAGFQILFGGKISAYLKLCEEARAEAFGEMVNQAHAAGANAVICMRYDANEVMKGVTEVLAYGTAVVVEKI